MKNRSPIGRVEANRLNAQKSTGPVTEAGKQRASFNAFRHGLTGQTVVLPWEDRTAYQAFCDQFFRDLKPQGVLEKQLVQTIADASWRLNRAAVLETNLFSLAVDRNQPGIDTGDSRADVALAMASALRDEGRTLSNLSLYCQRISNQRSRAITQLRELQAQRRAQESPRPEKVYRTAQSHGFEFTSFENTGRRAANLHLVEPSPLSSAPETPAENRKSPDLPSQFPESPRVS